MRVEWGSPVKYFLDFVDVGQESGERGPSLNEFIGQNIQIRFTGRLNCVACQRKINQTFNEGYCFPCFQKLAVCDSCVMRPQLCHFHQGTCREPEWGESHCQQPHYVYLANSSHLKVGLTRQNQIPVRWIDQGAIAAIPLFKVQTRHQAGVLEVLLKKYFSDTTQWQKMLKNDVVQMDLVEQKQKALEEMEEELDIFISQFGEEALEDVEKDEVTLIEFPVLEYPKKVTALNLLKKGAVNGKLLGIKGQYLILSSGVLNIRKHTGFHVEVEVPS